MQSSHNPTRNKTRHTSSPWSPSSPDVFIGPHPTHPPLPTLPPPDVQKLQPTMPVIVPRKNGAFMNVSYDALESADPDLTEEAQQAAKRLLRELKLKGSGDFWLGMRATSHSDMWWHMGR